MGAGGEARMRRRLLTGDSRSLKAGRVNERMGAESEEGGAGFFPPVSDTNMGSRSSPEGGGWWEGGRGGQPSNSSDSTQQLLDIPHPFRGVDLPLPSRSGGAQPMSTCKTPQWAGGCTRLVFGMLTDCELMGANAKKVCVCARVCAHVYVCVCVCVSG